MNKDHARKMLEHQRRPPVWSYSNLSDYLICPRRYYRRHIKKDVEREEKSQAQLRGIDVHEAFRVAIRRGGELPASYAEFEPFVAPIRKVPEGQRFAELKLGMTQAGASSDFFDHDTWGRGVLDVVVLGRTALLFDWKLGKSREDPLELSLQALLLKAKYPDIVEIVGRYVWLKDGRLGKPHDVSDTVSTRAWVDEKLEEIANRLEYDAWPPDENPLCRYCNVHDCEYWRDPDGGRKDIQGSGADRR